jgi:hypothetical protein
MEAKERTTTYPPEVPARAVRVVTGQQGEHGPRWSASGSIAARIGGGAAARRSGTGCGERGATGAFEAGWRARRGSG